MIRFPDIMSREQTWDPDQYARNARFVAELGLPVVELLNAKPGERVLDLGCGDGFLTKHLASLGLQVTGIDSSPAQVEAARALGLDARVMDAASLSFDAEFDAVFSNAALHWIKQPDAVIEGVARALKPGGRFVGELGGFGCVAKIRAALADALSRRGLDGESADPWYFPTVADYRARLEGGGFVVRSIALIPRPTPLPGDISGWLETFAGCFISLASEKPAFIAEVVEALRPDLYSEGKWTADYVRLRFAAVKQTDAG